jgi:hypothetical protein
MDRTKTFGTEARLDDDRDLDKGRRRHHSGFCRFDGFVEGTAFGFVLKDRQQGGSCR